MSRPVRTLPPLELDPGRARSSSPGRAARAGPRAARWGPLVAEPSSRWWPHALRTGPWLLGRPGLRPAQIVVLGRPTLHRGVAALLADPSVAVFADPGPDGAP